jgi:transposase
MTSLQNATPKLYIGLDVHKKTWSAHFKTDICDHKGMSIPPSFDFLYNYVRNHFSGHEVHLVYEAGCCGFSAARQSLNCGWNTVVVNPADISSNDKDNYTKTDKKDALSMSKLLQQGMLHSIYIPTEQKEQLNMLLRQRNIVTKSLRRIKSQIKGYLLYSGIEIPVAYDNANWSIAFKEWLSGLQFSHSTGKLTLDYKLAELKLYYSQYLQIANDLRKYCRAHHTTDYYLLKSIPGIGGYLASAILAELGDLRRFANEKEFSSYVGMVPGMHVSAGKNSNNRITPRCRALMRSYLVEAAWVTLRHDPEMQAYYRKHVGKNSKSVIIKIAHKLVKRILSVIKNQTPYVVNHTLQLDKELVKELPELSEDMLINDEQDAE